MFKKLLPLVLLFVNFLSPQIIFAQSLSQGIRLFENKQYDRASQQLEPIKKGTPDFAESRYYLALIAFQAKDYTKAEDHLKQALAANDKQGKYHYAMANLLGVVAQNSNMIRQAALASRIKTHLEKAVELDPKAMEPASRLVGFYMVAPKMMGGDPEKAKQVAANMLKVDAAEGHRITGFIADREKRPNDAERHFKLAVQAGPDSLKYYEALGSFYNSQKRFADAMKVYEDAMTRFPQRNNLLLQAGRMGAQAGNANFSKATDYLNRYLGTLTDKRDRSAANAHYYLGLIQKESQNNALAKNHFQEALKINPEHKASQDALKGIN